MQQEIEEERFETVRTKIKKESAFTKLLYFAKLKPKASVVAEKLKIKGAQQEEAEIKNAGIIEKKPYLPLPESLFIFKLNRLKTIAKLDKSEIAIKNSNVGKYLSASMFHALAYKK